MKAFIFAALATLAITPVQAASLWHCIADDGNENHEAIVLHTGPNNLITVFDADGVEKLSVRVESMGLDDSGKMNVYQYSGDRVVVLFMRPIEGPNAGFSIVNLETKQTRLWMCK